MGVGKVALPSGISGVSCCEALSERESGLVAVKCTA